MRYVQAVVFAALIGAISEPAQPARPPKSAWSAPASVGRHSIAQPERTPTSLQYPLDAVLADHLESVPGAVSIGGSRESGRIEPRGNPAPGPSAAPASVARAAVSDGQSAEVCSRCPTPASSVGCARHHCDWLGAFRLPNADLYRGRPFDYRRTFDYPWEVRSRRCFDDAFLPLVPLAGTVPQHGSTAGGGSTVGSFGGSQPALRLLPANNRYGSNRQPAPLPEGVLGSGRALGGSLHAD